GGDILVVLVGGLFGDFPDGIVEGQFSRRDLVAALGCLEPTFEPRATEFVAPRADGKADMLSLISQLIERGHAYVAGGEVLFDTASMPDYGELS
ncbi:hypothetical protein EN808_36030, partial [Mesorhizobium sp. M8A.F.Ca.ET.165.01.1.1]